MLAVAIIGSVASAQDSTPDGFHPVETRTGNSTIDTVIDAIASQDGDAAASLVESTEVACGPDAGMPDCPPGVESGTLIDVFPNAACEAEYLPADEAADAVRNLVESQQLYVYSVYESPVGPNALAGYRIVTGTGPAGDGVSFDISQDGAIVAIVRCGPAANMTPPGADFILAPVDDSTPTPTQPSAETPNGFYDEGSYTGNSAVDPVINTVYVQNGDVIASLIEGDADGEFPYTACEPEYVSVEDAGEMLSDAITGEQHYVYAVYNDPRSPSEDAAYRVIFGTALDESGLSIDISESGDIVAVVVCGAPANMIGLPGTTYLLEPADGTPTPTATATATPTRTATATPTRQIPNPPNTGTGTGTGSDGGSGDLLAWSLVALGLGVFAIGGATGMAAARQRSRR
jgi:hypothetical protein